MLVGDLARTEGGGSAGRQLSAPSPWAVRDSGGSYLRHPKLVGLRRGKLVPPSVTGGGLGQSPRMIEGSVTGPRRPRCLWEPGEDGGRSRRAAAQGAVMMGRTRQRRPRLRQPKLVGFGEAGWFRRQSLEESWASHLA